MAAIEDAGSLSEQAAADAAEVVRGKRWLQRVVELADSVRPECPPVGDVPASPPRPDHDRRAS